MTILRFLFLLTLIPLSLSAQQIEILTSGVNTSIRGLSVVNDNILWVSGSNGTVGKSTDGGKNWRWITVKGYEKNDFRDIEAFSDKTAIIMAIAEPAYILKTTDGGENWNLVYSDSTKGVFLDAMDFYDKKNGVIVGDPVDSKFYIIKTTDGGNTWARIPWVMQSNSVAGEGCFAASGTNIHYFKNKDFLFVSGGPQSRLHDDSGGRIIPIIQGRETTGANSIAVKKRSYKVHNRFVIVGGDFGNNKDTTQNCILTHDGGETWIKPATPPHGYRSCVDYISRKMLIACGTSGVDISTDKGMNWKLLSEESFHVCQKAKKGKAVFLAGGNGRIARLIYK